jgi:hypothetical protein
LRQKIKLLQKQNHTLEESLKAATKVPSLPGPLVNFFLYFFIYSILVFFSKISFAFFVCSLQAAENKAHKAKLILEKTRTELSAALSMVDKVQRKYEDLEKKMHTLQETVDTYNEKESESESETETCPIRQAQLKT